MLPNFKSIMTFPKKQEKFNQKEKLCNRKVNTLLFKCVFSLNYLNTVKLVIEDTENNILLALIKYRLK